MDGKKEEMATKESVLGNNEYEVTAGNSNTLSMDKLIERISSLSENKNPYTVSKEIEEIKSIFYIKLKSEKKETISTEEFKTEEENIKKELHPLEIKFKSALSAYRKIKSDFRKTKEDEEEKNLKIKRQLIEGIQELVREEESIKITFEKFRAIQERWKNTGHVPITQSNDLWQSYHHHIELFYDFIKINNDLRDLDFKRNLEEKTTIYEKAESLLKEKSVNKAHINLQELHEHWKNVGPVERDQREPLWQKFQEISKEINKKRNDYFIQKKETDYIKLEEKNIISRKIENLTTKKRTSHNEWEEATNNCNALEKKWKKLVGLNKDDNKIAWKNLRDSLSNFYYTKNAFYKQRKESIKQILESKLAICEKAENLQKSIHWQETGKELIKLQKEWKDSDSSPSKQSQEIWGKFRSACDTFFKARKAHYKKIEIQEEDAYKEKEILAKELERFKASSDTKEGIARLKEFSFKWRDIGNVPRNKMEINNQFLKLLNSKFEELGLNKKALATEKYKNKVSSLKGNSKAINSEQLFIRKKIDILKKEINQYENNISFFGSGKSTLPLLEQTQNKIDTVKSDIENLKQKIQLLNKA